MTKYKLGNITLYLLEDYEVIDSKAMVNDTVKRIREFNKHTVYFECMRELIETSKDFMSCGYTMDEAKTKNLSISKVDSAEELLIKLEHCAVDEGIKEMYFNFPDTVVDGLPNIPEDYDFISVLMHIITLGGPDNMRTYGNMQFNLTAQKSALKSIEILDYKID